MDIPDVVNTTLVATLFLDGRVLRRQDINPLDNGILYVAKFHTDGTGEWLPLTKDNPRLAVWSLNRLGHVTEGVTYF